MSLCPISVFNPPFQVISVVSETVQLHDYNAIALIFQTDDYSAMVAIENLPLPVGVSLLDVITMLGQHVRTLDQRREPSQVLCLSMSRFHLPPLFW